MPIKFISNHNIYPTPPEDGKDRAAVLNDVRWNGNALKYASGMYKNDRDIVLAAVTQNGTALQYAAAALRSDRDIVMTAVRQNWRALRYAAAALKDDREIVLAAVQKAWRALDDASDRLRGDREIAITALRQNVYIISGATKKIRGDRDIILSVVRRNGMALQYASQELKNDRNIVAAAVGQNWRAIRYAAQTLQNDADIARLAAREKDRQSSCRKQGVNFLWLNLDLPAKPDPEDGSIRMPMPEEYIQNVRDAAKRHPCADMNLWVDARRLTKKQLAYLAAVAEDGLPNVHVRNLCSIPAYKNEELYSRPETKKNWRSGYQGVVWLQVDAAKILISLQGDYDQSFFADLDHAHLDIESSDVQKMLAKNGLLIGSSGECSSMLENQLWGFDRSRKTFFAHYYAAGLRLAYQGQIAFNALDDTIAEALDGFEGLSERALCLPIGSIGLDHAVQPGHKWSTGGQYTGYAYKGRAAVSAGELKAVFNKRSRRHAKMHPAAPAAARAAPAAFSRCRF